MIIRAENESDIENIQTVIQTAFGRAEEARLVNSLRRGGNAAFSAVAVLDSNVIGHIFFSPVIIEGEDEKIQAVGLAPLAVLPEYQKRGIGSALVRHAFDELYRTGHRLVVVLGEPAFYSRFGFAPSKSHGIGCRFEVPEENMMIVELESGILAARGDKPATIVYLPEFNGI